MKQDELQIHIEKLHDYNEMKDVGQMLLGRLGQYSLVDQFKDFLLFL